MNETQPEEDKEDDPDTDLMKQDSSNKLSLSQTNRKTKNLEQPVNIKPLEMSENDESDHGMDNKVSNVIHIDDDSSMGGANS